MIDIGGKQYLFVIDTDAYAGNFERELCAYITGKIGECGVGEEQAEIARAEIPEVIARLEDLVALVPDEHGCARPVSIFPNPKYGGAYNSVAIHFNQVPDARILDVLKERAKKALETEIGLRAYGREKFKIEGFRFFEQEVVQKEINLG